MEVIVRNGTPERRKWCGTCRSCGSEVTAVESELTGITHDHREGGRFSWEKCPVCKHGPFGGLLLYPTKAG